VPCSLLNAKKDQCERGVLLGSELLNRKPMLCKTLEYVS